MMTELELKLIKSQLHQGDFPSVTVEKLIGEIDRLKQYILDYSKRVTTKIEDIDSNIDLLEAENQKLIVGKTTAFIERDACIGLIAQFAAKTGLTTGTGPGNIVVVDLPAGQVSWEINETEKFLFENLGPYSAPIEELTVEEKYSRVMNSGLDQAATQST